MAVNRRPVGTRPRWPDLVLVVAIVALAGLGGAVLFGPAVAGWLSPEPATSPLPAGARR